MPILCRSLFRAIHFCSIGQNFSHETINHMHLLLAVKHSFGVSFGAKRCLGPCGLVARWQCGNVAK